MPPLTKKRRYRALGSPRRKIELPLRSEENKDLDLSQMRQVLSKSSYYLWKWIFVPTVYTNKRLFEHTYVPIGGYLYLLLEHIRKYADCQHQ